MWQIPHFSSPCSPCSPWLNVNSVQLKKLQLLGFKTFADKTEIEIDQGLTAIVGPNGSAANPIS